MTFSFLESHSSNSTNASSSLASGVVDISLAVHHRHKKSGHFNSEVRHIVQVTLVLAFVFSLFLIDDAAMGDTASLTLYVGNQQRLFVGEVVEDMTILDALSAASSAGNFKFGFASNGDRVRITELLGISEVDEVTERITLFLNGQKVDPSTMSNMSLKPNDSVVVKVLKSRP